MDPNANWSLMREAYLAGDWCRLHELAEALVDWLDGGGFPPRTTPHSTRADGAWDHFQAREVAAAALEEAARHINPPR